MAVVLLFLDPIAWAVWLVLFFFKIILFLITAFVFLNIVVWLKYTIGNIPSPKLTSEDMKEIKEATKAAAKEDGQTLTDLELIQQVTDNQLYRNKIFSNALLALGLMFFDYLLSWFVFSTGDGLIFGWTRHWCIFLSPTLQLMWSYSAGTTTVWLSWSVMVHFVFASALHLFFHQHEWVASSPVTWIQGLVSGLYRTYLSTGYGAEDAQKYAAVLGIESDMVAATTDLAIVTKAYKKAALRWHPDRQRVWSTKGFTKEQATNKFRECEEAQTALKDEYIQTQARATSFVTRTCPVVLVVTVLDSFTLRFVWGGDSWWPLAWLFWTLISHVALAVLLWFVIPSVMPAHVGLSRSGHWFKVALGLISVCSVLDGYLASGWCWRRYGDGATSAWFLYWELLWCAGAIVTHVVACMLLVLATNVLGVGDEWLALEKFQKAYEKKKKKHELSDKEEEEHFSNALYTFFTHRHTLMKVATMLGVSGIDFYWTNAGLFWNTQRYSWPWSFCVCLVFIMIALLRLVFLLLALLHFAGTTGPLRKYTAMSVLPVVLIAIVTTLSLGVDLERNFEFNGLMSGGGLTVEEVAQSMFAEAETFAHTVLDDDDDDDVTFESSSGEMEEHDATGEDRGGWDGVESAESVESVGSMQDEENVGGENKGGENDKDGAKNKSNRSGSSGHSCTWLSWAGSHIVRVFVPAGYVILAARRKEVWSLDKDDTTAQRRGKGKRRKKLTTMGAEAAALMWSSAVLRWTTVTCGMSLWFGTMDPCSASPHYLSFAVSLFLLSARANVLENSFPLGLLQSAPCKWLLRGLCMLYFPYDNWNDAMMLRMYACLALPCIAVSCGLLLLTTMRHTYVDSWFDRETYWGTFREIVSGDTASEEFQNWFDSLLKD